MQGYRLTANNIRKYQHNFDYYDKFMIKRNVWLFKNTFYIVSLVAEHKYVISRDGIYMHEKSRNMHEKSKKARNMHENMQE